MSCSKDVARLERKYDQLQAENADLRGRLEALRKAFEIGGAPRSAPTTRR